MKLHHPRLHETPPTSSALQADECRGIFIRAPGVLRVTSPDIKVLATVADNGSGSTVVGVQQDHLIATTFHPELTNDLRWHNYFINQILEKRFSQMSTKTAN